MEKKSQTFVIEFVLRDAFNTTLYILLKKKKKKLHYIMFSYIFLKKIIINSICTQILKKKKFYVCQPVNY